MDPDTRPDSLHQYKFIVEKLYRCDGSDILCIRALLCSLHLV